MEKQAIIVQGNLVDGFEFVGPFESGAIAVEAADKIDGGDWWVADLEPAGELATPSVDPWADDPEYGGEDWRQDVANGDTRLGYADWVAHNRETAESESAIKIGADYLFTYPNFGTPAGFPEHAQHSGQIVTVMAKVDPDKSALPMFIVRARDGWEGEVNPEELG